MTDPWEPIEFDATRHRNRWHPDTIAELDLRKEWILPFLLIPVGLWLSVYGLVAGQGNFILAGCLPLFLGVIQVVRGPRSRFSSILRFLVMCCAVTPVPLLLLLGVFLALSGISELFRLFAVGVFLAAVAALLWAACFVFFAIRARQSRGAA